MAVLLHFNALIDGHGAIIADIIKAVSAAIVTATSTFLAAGIGAAVQNYSAANLVMNGCLLMRDIIYRSAAADGQGSATFHNNRVIRLIRKVGIQNKLNVLALGDGDVLFRVFQQRHLAAGLHCINGCL